MKTIVACLFLIVVCVFLYNKEHPFGRPSIPNGHQYAADGVYFLRTAYSIPAATGPIQWSQGQQVFEDRLSKSPAPAGMILVTDGSHSAPIPSNMLSQDMQEGEALRQVEIDAQAREALAKAETRVQLQAQTQLQAQAAAKAEQERQRAELERQRAEQERQRAETEAKVEEARLLAARARQPSPTPKFGHTALDQPNVVKPARSGYYNGYYYPVVPTPVPQ